MIYYKPPAVPTTYVLVETNQGTETVLGTYENYDEGVAARLDKCWYKYTFWPTNDPRDYKLKVVLR